MEHIDKRYIKYVRDYQPELLAKPRKKDEELNIIFIETGLWSSCL